MSRSRVTVRAFNKDGYHKDLVRMDASQVRMKEARVGRASGSTSVGGPIGIGVRIDPSEFPEMIYFDVVVHDE